MANPGMWQGDLWIEPDGYCVSKKFVEKYPHLYGPCAEDPDHGCGDTELKDDALAKLFEKVSGPGGIFSTAAEQHCYETAAEIGYNFVESSADIPPVPKFWLGEGHYWLSGITSGRLVKKKNVAEAAALALETLPGLLKNKEVLLRITAIATVAMTAGVTVVPPLVQAIYKVLGIG